MLLAVSLMPIGMPKSKSLNQKQLQHLLPFKVSNIEHGDVQERTKWSGMKNNFSLIPDQLQYTQLWKG